MARIYHLRKRDLLELTPLQMKEFETDTPTPMF
jgi:hypothetical protein